MKGGVKRDPRRAVPFTGQAEEREKLKEAEWREAGERRIFKC